MEKKFRRESKLEGFQKPGAGADQKIPGSATMLRERQITMKDFYVCYRRCSTPHPMLTSSRTIVVSNLTGLQHYAILKRTIFYIFSDK